VPVILSDSALLAPEVAGLGVGICCNTRHDAELADAMSSTARDDELVGAMSRRAFELRNNCASDPDTWTAQIVSHYQALLARKHPALVNAGRAEARSPTEF